jgi:DNA-binding transcriptional LysR family regulator
MIKFHQLNAFKAVYELGTMTAASKHIHITQPAISRLISSLEHQLGFELFQRIKGRLLPTDQGKAFYFEVSKAFIALDTLEDSARDIRSSHHGNLHISAFPVLSNSFLPSVLGRFLRQENTVKASLSSYRSEEVLRRTEIQSCDIGFALTDNFINSPSVTAQVIEGNCVCILPMNSPLKDKKQLTPEDIVLHPFIRYESSDHEQNTLDRIMRSHSVRTNDVLEVSFANVAAMLVSEGIGMAVVDPFTALHASNSGLNILIKEFNPAIPFKFHVLFPALRPISGITKSFVQFFLQCSKEAGIELTASS